LRAVVPVPRRDDAGAGADAAQRTAAPAPRPIYVSAQPYWLALWIGIGLVLALFVRSRAVTTSS